MACVHNIKTLFVACSFPGLLHIFTACAAVPPFSPGTAPPLWPLDTPHEPSWDNGAFSADSLRIAAEAWLGVPYSYGAEGPDSIDCSAFVRHVYLQATGLELPRRAAWQATRGYSVPREMLEAGDLVFFAAPETPEIDHVGIYLGNRSFINATVTRGVAYSSLDDPYWKERYRKAVRIVLPLRESID